MKPTAEQVKLSYDFQARNLVLLTCVQLYLLALTPMLGKRWFHQIQCVSSFLLRGLLHMQMASSEQVSLKMLLSIKKGSVRRHLVAYCVPFDLFQSKILLCKKNEYGGSKGMTQSTCFQVFECSAVCRPFTMQPNKVI